MKSCTVHECAVVSSESVLPSRGLKEEDLTPACDATNVGARVIYQGTVDLEVMATEEVEETLDVQDPDLEVVVEVEADLVIDTEAEVDR